MACGTRRQFRPDAPEHRLLNMWDEESIEIGGSPIYYYEVIIPTAKIDRLYLECRSKLYNNFPVELWATYDPQPQNKVRGPFGWDSQQDNTFELNWEETLKRIGHPPKVGSRIWTPHLNEDWALVSTQLDLFQMWGKIRVKFVCQRFQEVLTTGEGTVTKSHPSIQMGF